jgi:predicted PurR-regulated permease PerM
MGTDGTTEAPSQGNGATSRWYAPLVRASDWSWRILVVLALVGVVVWAGIALSAIVVPTLLAVVVIPVGRPLYQRLAQRIPRSAAAAAVLFIAFAVLIAATWLMIRSIAANWDALAAGIGDAAASIVDWLDDRASGLDGEQLAEIQANLQDLAGTIAGVLIGGATRSVAALGSFVVGLFLFLVTLFFGVRDWDLLQSAIVRGTVPVRQDETTRFLDRFDTLMRGYWKGQALIGLFNALALGIGLWIIGVPLAAPIAMLTFVISFIPYVGAIISSFLAVFVALGTGGTGDAIWALLLSLFTFNTGENLVRPYLVGETVKMPTFVVFIASTVGVLVAGALGAILAVPLVAVVDEYRKIFYPAGEAAADSPG